MKRRRPLAGARSTQIDPDPLRHWRHFVKVVRARLNRGRLEYADHDSFSRDPEELLGEIEEELVDVCGWGFILWVRLQRLRSEVRRGRRAGGLVDV
jgi:hypothetical protein